MVSGAPESATQILDSIRKGEKDAQERLFRIVYEELRRMAHHHMSKEAHHVTLQTTALVNEAYLRLFKDEKVEYENRRHFFGAAAQAMRRILIDRARERLSIKRNWGNKRITLDENVPDAERPVDVLALDEALKRLTQESPRQAEVVEYRYFLGLTVQETAELLAIAPRTVNSDWQLAKAWLRREISKS